MIYPRTALSGAMGVHGIPDARTHIPELNGQYGTACQGQTKSRILEKRWEGDILLGLPEGYHCAIARIHRRQEVR